MGQITCKAMCKMLMSIESGPELETMQREVGCVCEAMLAFPLRFKWARFYKGLQVYLLYLLGLLLTGPNEI